MITVLHSATDAAYPTEQSFLYKDVNIPETIAEMIIAIREESAILAVGSSVIFTAKAAKREESGIIAKEKIRHIKKLHLKLFPLIMCFTFNIRKPPNKSYCNLFGDSYFYYFFLKKPNFFLGCSSVFSGAAGCSAGASLVSTAAAVTSAILTSMLLMAALRNLM